jgi:PBSX family phage terminase large subunit
MTGMKAINPYEPLPWHFEALRDKSPILLLTGSAGGGKSRCAGEKVHAFMLKYPGATGLALRKARQWTTKSIIPFMEKTVIGRDRSVVKKKTDGYFQYANGSMLYWGGMKDEEQRESLRSIGQDGALDFVWVEEGNAFSEADFEELMARMRGKAAPWRQILITTNPGPPSHWIYKRLIKGGQAKVITSSYKDNPYNPADYADTLNRLTGARRERLLEGRWTQAEGMVYADYDANIHLKDSFEVPKEWRRFRSIDFGYTNPFVCQWWAIDQDGRMYLYREIYMTQRLVEDHARQINELSKGESYEATVADHDAEDRATLAKYGIHTIAAEKDIASGIQSMQARIRVAGDDKPRFYIMRDALVEVDENLVTAKKPTCTADEIDGYVWQPMNEGKSNKEVPIKVDDHGMDAARYACKQADKGVELFFISGR